MLICTALCCAASSAFPMGGPPPTPTPSITSLTFKDAAVANCAGSTVGSVNLNGPGTPDVAVQSTTTSGGIPVTSGKVQLQIATTVSAGVATPTSAGTAGVCWIRIDGMGGGVDVDANGQACFPVDLDDLASLTGLTDCSNNPVTLNNVTCATSLVGFRAHYVGQPNYPNSFSDGTDLTISCTGGVCGTNTNFTIGYELSDGIGNPCPGTTNCWTYIMKVQNCTATDLTNVKIQGGTAGWLNQGSTTATSDVAPQPTITNNRRNSVITWIGNIPQGTEVNISVHVCGTVARTDGTTEFLSGAWSATGTDPDGNRVTTGYTGQVTIMTDSTSCGP